MTKFLLLIICFLSLNAHASIESILGSIPVQDSGRVKPLETFAQESLQLVYGKKQFQGRKAVEIVFTWILLPTEWDSTEFVQVDNKELKEKLNLDTSKRWFSPDTLLKNDRLDVLLQGLKAKQENKEKLNVFYQAIQRLQNQITVYKGIGKGYIPGWYPLPESTTWAGLKDFDKPNSENFLAITHAFTQAIKDPSQEADLKEQTKKFVEKIKTDHPNYFSENKIKTEMFYNKFQPFRWAWILYFLSAALFLFYFISPKQFLAKISLCSIVTGFLLHTCGFVLRVIIADRPPVSNMYETVVWVPWGTVLFSLIFYKMTKNKYFLFGSALVSFFCLLLADFAPVILDASIQPLQPVLRSNLWLTVHVLTITVSYGALFLSFILADICLYFYFINEQKYSSVISSLRDSVYRAIQVGVVLLGTGIILGGVWADYSWGRFWGWDPKETWALIAFLGYIAILHGRQTNWIKPFGFVLWTVIAFNLVVMAWYGVNFVLGAGLHSYGFGGGGVPFVSTLAALHILFCATVWFKRIQKNN